VLADLEPTLVRALARVADVKELELPPHATNTNAPTTVSNTAANRHRHLLKCSRPPVAVEPTHQQPRAQGSRWKLGYRPLTAAQQPELRAQWLAARVILGDFAGRRCCSREIVINGYVNLDDLICILYPARSEWPESSAAGTPAVRARRLTISATDWPGSRWSVRGLSSARRRMQGSGRGSQERPDAYVCAYADLRHQSDSDESFIV
jgi:hypothetical protein